MSRRAADGARPRSASARLMQQQQRREPNTTAAVAQRSATVDDEQIQLVSQSRSSGVGIGAGTGAGTANRMNRAPRSKAQHDIMSRMHRSATCIQAIVRGHQTRAMHRKTFKQMQFAHFLRKKEVELSEKEKRLSVRSAQLLAKTFELSGVVATPPPSPEMRPTTSKHEQTFLDAGANTGDDFDVGIVVDAAAMEDQWGSLNASLDEMSRYLSVLSRNTLNDGLVHRVPLVGDSEPDQSLVLQTSESSSKLAPMDQRQSRSTANGTPVLITATVAATEVGAVRLLLGSYEGVKLGQLAMVGSGLLAEMRVVVAMGSIIFAVPLEHAHAAGTQVQLFAHRGSTLKPRALDGE